MNRAVAQLRRMRGDDPAWLQSDGAAIPPHRTGRQIQAGDLAAVWCRGSTPGSHAICAVAGTGDRDPASGRLPCQVDVEARPGPLIR